MATNAAQLLKQLEPAVRPSAVPSALSHWPATFESQSFDQLLALAKNGSIQSGRQIEVPIEITPPLSALQLERLATAADQAEAQGAKQALMLIDGRAFVLDVPNRRLISELTEMSAAQLKKVDSAMCVPAEHAQAPFLPVPDAGVLPASLLKHLQQQM